MEMIILDDGMYHLIPVTKEMLKDLEKGLELVFKAFKIRMDWRANRQNINPEKDFQM